MLGCNKRDNEASESLNDGEFLDSFTARLPFSERSSTVWHNYFIPYQEVFNAA